MFLPVGQITNTNSAPPINMRCPHCRRAVTMSTLGFPDASIGQAITGQRVCNNPECRAHVFIVRDRSSGDVVLAYPGETIDFDASDIPERIVAAFEEAIDCHAQRCFVASAIMVRKTLEELCNDRGATGGNLKQRIASLGQHVVLPQPMLDGLDDLRLLGNDAAHLESRVRVRYEHVTPQERNSNR